MMRHEEFETVIIQSGLHDDNQIYERVLGDLVVYLLNRVETIPEEEDDMKHNLRLKAYYIFDYLEHKGWFDVNYSNKEEILGKKWYMIQIWGSKDAKHVSTTFGTYPDVAEWSFNKMKEIDGKTVFIKEITREEVLA